MCLLLLGPFPFLQLLDVLLLMMDPAAMAMAMAMSFLSLQLTNEKVTIRLPSQYEFVRHSEELGLNSQTKKQCQLKEHLRDYGIGIPCPQVT
jgi:hypothetical protein